MNSKATHLPNGKSQGKAVSKKALVPHHVHNLYLLFTTNLCLQIEIYEYLSFFFTPSQRWNVKRDSVLWPETITADDWTLIWELCLLLNTVYWSECWTLCLLLNTVFSWFSAPNLVSWSECWGGTWTLIISVPTSNVISWSETRSFGVKIPYEEFRHRWQ